MTKKLKKQARKVKLCKKQKKIQERQKENQCTLYKELVILSIAFTSLADNSLKLCLGTGR